MCNTLQSCRSTFSSRFEWRQLSPCLHVTHGLLCPSPALSSLNLLAKYVKANPGPSMLFKTGLHHGGAAERLQWTLRGSIQPVNRENNASLWINSSSDRPAFGCRSRWCCRALAVPLPGHRSSQIRLTETDPAACPLLPASPAAALDCCCPGGHCSRWACCSCCSAAPWWRCPLELCPSATHLPSETPVPSGLVPR